MTLDLSKLKNVWVESSHGEVAYCLRSVTPTSVWHCVYESESVCAAGLRRLHWLWARPCPKGIKPEPCDF